ncbi:hypothetical protein NUW54_g6066 [Trametes sanguinea]|uniref:Uncharacterized protein n=1 Tax=Trametes sanguinea TaxID=158606 RepID=A0ACC1PTV0_9APHY|nr:hypothetical protein NUW54_g6066 [Trametes sanguinea]
MQFTAIFTALAAFAVTQVSAGSYIVREYDALGATDQGALHTCLDNYRTDNWTGTLNMGTARSEPMRACLHHIRREYAGIEAFLTKRTSLTDEDFRRIRENLHI